MVKVKVVKRVEPHIIIYYEEDGELKMKSKELKAYTEEVTLKSLELLCGIDHEEIMKSLEKEGEYLLLEKVEHYGLSFDEVLIKDIEVKLVRSEDEDGVELNELLRESQEYCEKLIEKLDELSKKLYSE